MTRTSPTREPWRSTDNCGLRERPRRRQLNDRNVPAQLALGLAVPAVVIAVVASGCGAHSRASSGFSGQPTVRAARSDSASPLTVIKAPTPRFRVPRYDTRGTYPQVRGSDLDLRKVNAALREAVLADQRQYAPYARKAARVANPYRGVYRTSVDRRLISASTVVVSALMPATELYPGGSLGKGWLAVTVRVPSGAPVRITDLFATPSRGLRVLAKAWKAQVRRANPETWPCVRLHLPDYRPSASNYRYFALALRGLAVGFWQEEACNRLQATVPYPILRPYLSKLGARLIAGVRRPRQP
jgi:hypothetical protein